MKIVSLCGPALIAGAVRYPVEGPLTVTDKQAEQLKDSGRLDGEPEDLPSLDIDADEGDALGGKSIAELKAIASEEQIDLGTATKKAEIIAAIRKAREDKEA